MSSFEDSAAELAVLLQGLAVMLEPIKEAAQGYREEMKRLGFNEEAANQMAVHYHEVVMTIMKNQAFGGKR